MSKCNIITYKTSTSLKKEIKYNFVWSIAQRVGINVTVLTSVDVVGVCIFKVALRVYQVNFLILTHQIVTMVTFSKLFHINVALTVCRKPLLC